jgi:adenine-specific DNA-methyltransferase
MLAPLAQLRHALGAAAVDEPDRALWQGDAVELLKRVPDASVQLVLTSPPYNIGKAYEPRRSVDEYIAWCSTWLVEIPRILTPTGAAWINLGYLSMPGRGAAVPIPYLLWPHLDLHLIQELVWQQPSCRPRWRGKVEGVACALT